jgi:hydrogenase maturation protease
MTDATNISQFVVLAIGNTLLRDDGIGATVLGELSRRNGIPSDTRLVDGGTIGFPLAGELEACAGLVVVDASRMGATPGTVRRFEADEMDRQLGTVGRSVHEVGLADLLDMARLTDDLPPRRALVGIEPARVDWGDALSPPVRAAIPTAVAEVIAILEGWRATTRQAPSAGARIAAGEASP